MLLTAFVFLTAASCDAEATGIVVADVTRTTVTEVVDAPAAVAARAAATMTAAADGTLAKLLVAPGAQVKKGQVLAVVDSPSAQARLAQAKQALAAAKRSGGGGVSLNLGGATGRLDDAAADAFAHARAAAGHIADPALRAALLAQIAAAEQNYRAAAKAVASAVNGVGKGLSSLGSAMSALGAAQKLQAQQAYDLAKSTVDALTLRAPIPGVVQLGGVSAAPSGSSLTDLLGGLAGGAVPSAGGAQGSTPAGVEQSVPVGGLVTAGAAILTVVDVSALSLVAEVDETDILLVKAGIAAEAELDAATGAVYAATVQSIDVLPTANSRGAVAYRVRLSLGEGKFADGSVAPTPRPGMSAVAHLKVREAPDTVAIPSSAIFSADGRDAVWLVDPDGRAARRDIRLGVAGTQSVQVLDGLKSGDRIVVKGVDKVHAGDALP
ncbi:efflux RND transporter periplasmic adaptor subunit [Allocatelliglobosispora scoriae]|uniref:efflux RND transporter periplasmic adaptor subunit n=1 Tax=Allocatelliglobosispora scoriae TaxID=643052 RepID=UPI0028AFA11C|nr:efflux RND transporter periplasmic adaptor subunit [Allocatelliglobosispora scoriae]